MRRFLLLLMALPLALALAGCDQLGIESPASTKARVEADGKAVGGACRHAGRAIEDCYTLNKKVERAAMYAGWREMNEYMTEYKLDTVAPVIPPEPPKPPKPPKKPAGDAEDGEDATDSQPAAKH